MISAASSACGGSAAAARSGHGDDSPSGATAQADRGYCPAPLKSESWLQETFGACTAAPYGVPFEVCSDRSACARPCRVTERYQREGAPTTTTARVEYDAQGRLVGVEPLDIRWHGLERCTYDGDRLASCVVPGAGREVYRRDDRGRLVEVQAEDGSSWTIAWGDAGVVGLERKQMSGGMLDLLWSFEHDGGGRVVSIRSGAPGRPGSKEAVEYDPQGRISRSLMTETDALNEAALREERASKARYEYDAMGRPVADDGGRRYTWDASGRLVREVLPGRSGRSVETTWEYDCP